MCEKPSSGRPNARTAAAESPPPTTLNAPLAVAAAITLATPLVPAAKAGNSKTPIGPFQKMVSALVSSVVNLMTDPGPMSSPILPSGIASAATSCDGESAANLSATTKSTGRRNTSAYSSSNRRQVSIISVCSSDVPTGRPAAARNVKHMPPPMTMLSALVASCSITPSLSDTFEPAALLGDQLAGVVRQQRSDVVDRSLLAVHHTEPVGHESACGPD